MPNRHAAYPAAFREQILELVRAGRTPEELTRVYRRLRGLTIQVPAALSPGSS